MKNKFSTIYAIFASLIFVLTIFYFGFNLYSEYNHGYQRTKTTFDQLTRTIKNNPDKIKIDNINDFSFIEMRQNGTAFYKYPTKDSKSDASSRLIKNYFVAFKINEDNYFLSADMYLLRPASIRFYARNSFIIILIITLITILMIVTLSISEKDTVKFESEDTTPPSNEDTETQITYDEYEAELNKFKEDENAVSEPAVQKSEQTETVTAESKEENVTDSEPAVESVTTEEPVTETEPKIEEPVSIAEEQVQPVAFQQNDNNPYGLFSPKSGIGWESYLLTRLDNELNRAIASEFDLSVFVIKIENIEKDTDKLHQVCDYLTIQFQFKDMLFEYKEDCIAAIKISMSLDDAITFADKLHSDIEDITAEKCFIGISTRTIRIISGEKLLQEADEALKHAQEEKDTPIIAFRANAEKYRQYLEQNK